MPCITVTQIDDWDNIHLQLQALSGHLSIAWEVRERLFYWETF
jgi:hypothetical protein